jgi:hypothetical protein
VADQSRKIHSFADFEAKHWVMLAGICFFILIRVTSCTTQKLADSSQPPIDQNTFYDIVEDAFAKWKNSATNVEKGYVLEVRNQDLCKAFPSSKFVDWRGRIVKIESSGSSGRLLIDVTKNVSVKSQSIGPESPVYNYVLHAAKGQPLVISGHFERRTFTDVCFYSDTPYNTPNPAFEVTLDDIHYDHVAPSQ